MQNYIKHLEYGTRNIGLLSLVDPPHEKFNRHVLVVLISRHLELCYGNIVLFICIRKNTCWWKSARSFKLRELFFSLITKLLIKYAYRPMCLCVACEWKPLTCSSFWIPVNGMLSSLIHQHSSLFLSFWKSTN